VDISPERTHAIIAGREILKTIRIDGKNCAEEFNLRSAIINYTSTHNATWGSLPGRLKDNLAATDVKWSHGEYDKTIATAASNGRVIIYDLHRPGVELVKMHEHTRQVHRLAFNPVRAAVLLSGSSDSMVKLWDLRVIANNRGVMSCQSRQKFVGHSEAIRDVRWRPFEGCEFATAADSGVIQRWDIRNPNAPLLKINAHEKPCHSIDWHPDGMHILSAGLDGFIKVYDFSTTERRQKPLRKFRAPQPVMNARWRPPCWSSESQESGDWQSTQLVTSYVEKDSRIHLWDLKRPSLPFREFGKFEGACTDILWHSKDLLWTVGSEGMFMQTDIHFAPQVVQRRSLCSFDWNSSSGKLRLSTQRRPSRRASGVEDTSDFLISSGKERGSSGEKPAHSRSFTDDDENLLSSSFRKRYGRAPSSRSSKSLGGTPPSTEDGIAAMPLERTLEKCPKYEPLQRQILALVILNACPDPLVQRLYAMSNRQLLHYQAKGPTPDLLEDMAVLFEDIAKRAETALMYRLAQSWRIAGLAIIKELWMRAEGRVQRRVDEALAKEEEAEKQAEAEAEYQASLLDDKTGKVRNHLFKGVVEAEGRNGSPEPDSTSNITTPLAKPLPDSPLSTHGYPDQTSPLRNIPLNDKDLQPLPPSLLSIADPMNMDLKMLEDDEDGTLLFRSLNDQFDARKRNDSPELPAVISPPLPPSLDSISTSLLKEDRSAPRAIEGKAEWRKEKSDRSDSPNIPSFDRVAEARRSALRDYKAPHRTILNFDNPTESAQNRLLRAPFDRHDSSESFPMFSASTDSSHQARSLGGSFPATQYSDGSEPLLEPWEIEGASNNDAIRSGPMPDSQVIVNDPSDNDPDSFLHVTLSKTSTGHIPDYEEPPQLFRPQPPLLPLVDSPPSGLKTPIPPLSISEYHPSDFLQEPGSHSTATTTRTPWSSPNIIQHLLTFHARSQITIHLPATLLTLIQPYLNASHALISPQTASQIYTSYHSVLLRQGLVIEAAELRKLCANLYPSVYSYAQQLEDTFINVYCHICKTPFQNNTVNNYVCTKCRNKQAPCPVCLSVKPPAEWALEPGTSRMKGAGLWAWCQGCGHGGHVACMKRWLENLEMSEGGCASQGCLHDCGPGPRRQERTRLREEKERERSRGRAKRDSWTVAESKAVERTRSVLVGQGQAQGSSSGATTPTQTQSVSGGAVKEAKKVRLVIPSEEDGGGGVGGSAVTSATGSVASRRRGLLRWGSDGASERDNRDRDSLRERDGEVDSPVSRVSSVGMAASVD
jgi:WD repeat-containing protein 24